MERVFWNHVKSLLEPCKSSNEVHVWQLSTIPNIFYFNATTTYWTLHSCSGTIKKTGVWIDVFNTNLSGKETVHKLQPRSNITPYSNHFSSINHYGNFSTTWGKTKRYGETHKTVCEVLIASWIESKSECLLRIERACAKLSADWNKNHLVKSIGMIDKHEVMPYQKALWIPHLKIEYPRQSNTCIINIRT